MFRAHLHWLSKGQYLLCKLRRDCILVCSEIYQELFTAFRSGEIIITNGNASHGVGAALQHTCSDLRWLWLSRPWRAYVKTQASGRFHYVLSLVILLSICRLKNIVLYISFHVFFHRIAVRAWYWWLALHVLSWCSFFSWEHSSIVKWGKGCTLFRSELHQDLFPILKNELTDRNSARIIRVANRWHLKSACIFRHRIYDDDSFRYSRDFMPSRVVIITDLLRYIFHCKLFPLLSPFTYG